MQILNNFDFSGLYTPLHKKYKVNLDYGYGSNIAVSDYNCTIEPTTSNFPVFSSSCVEQIIKKFVDRLAHKLILIHHVHVDRLNYVDYRRFDNATKKLYEYRRFIDGCFEDNSVVNIIVPTLDEPKVERIEAKDVFPYMKMQKKYGGDGGIDFWDLLLEYVL